MITIFSDFNHLVKDKDTFIAQDVKDYVVAYNEILRVLDQKKDKTIYIRVPVVVNWFKRMAERYPQGSIIFEEIDARKYLQNLWGIQIPEDVSPDQLLSAGLLEIADIPNPGENFDDFILRVFYDQIYVAKNFHLSNLVEILQVFDEEKWKQNQESLLVYNIFLNRITNWRTNETDPDRRKIITKLEDQQKSLLHDLKRYKNLRFYESIGQVLMGEDYDNYRGLNLDLNNFSVNETEIPDVIQNVKYHLNQLAPIKDEKDLLSTIDSLSGLLFIEFDYLENMLLENPDLISEKVIIALSEKFSSLQDFVQSRVRKLRDLIMPEKPQKPNPSWGVDQMLKWATEEYLPYQSFCDKNNILDESLYPMSIVFSDWLVDNWIEINANSHRLVFNIFPNIANDFNQDNTINLVLVIDNLAWMMASDLEALLRQNDFNLISKQPYLSMLPSETEVSKKCLLAGTPTYKDIDESSYTTIIEKGWVPYFNDASFKYLGNPGNLKALESIDAKTFVVNFHGIDNALHMSSDKLGLPHVQHVHNILEGFVATIVAFIKKHHLQEHISIHVVTDHGSIRLPKKAKNKLKPEDFNDSKFPEVSHRFVSVTNIGYEQLSDYLKEDCAFIPSNVFGNDKHYLCAKGANRFKPTDETTYVHGGVSPEEVIVPYMKFEAIKERVQDLTVHLVDREFRYRQEQIIFDLGNPNRYKVDDIRLTVLNLNIKAEPTTIDSLGDSKMSRVAIDGLFMKTNNIEEKNSIKLQISYYCLGKRYSFTATLPIEMKSMVDLDTSMFDDLG